MVKLIISGKLVLKLTSCLLILLYQRKSIYKFVKLTFFVILNENGAIKVSGVSLNAELESKVKIVEVHLPELTILVIFHFNVCTYHFVLLYFFLSYADEYNKWFHLYKVC